MRRVFVLGYGLVAYVMFLAVFSTLADFVGQFGVVRSINGGPTAPTGEALATNLALIAAFGVSHSVLARSSVKQRLIRIIPAAAERSTYVLVASLSLALLVWQWRAMPAVIWQVDGVAAITLWVAHFAGAALLVASTFLTDHFDLFGLRQVWLHAQGRPYTAVPFVERSFYRYVRHPMMLGTLLWMWAAPAMTVGHLVFAASMSAYIVIGIAFEERGLARELGAPYADYRRRVPALVPRPRG